MSEVKKRATDDGCSIVLHQTNDGHHHWLCPNCKRENVSPVGAIDLSKFLPSVVCSECGFEFGVDKSALPAATEERNSTTDNDDDGDDYKQRQVEVEDDLRCGDCGSTEAGNCFFCKMD